MSNVRVSDISVIIVRRKRRGKRRNKQEGVMKVDNKLANEIIIAFREGKRIHDFMDAVAGVKKYRLDDISRQGHIRSMFAKELIREQFLLDFEDIISEFWRGVFENVDRAKLHGELVEIKAPGKKKETRPTNNNPVHYLRYNGYMAVRNHITALYRKNLQQGCATCGHKTVTKKDKKCPKCSSVMSQVYKFVELNNDTDDLHISTMYKNIENRDTANMIDRVVRDFAESVLKPGTRAYQVMRILTEPEASKSMCSACKLCDAITFDIDSCTNYNANIGDHLGVNKTMIANKIRSIRKRFPEWLHKQDSQDAQYLLQVIQRKSLRIIDV